MLSTPSLTCQEQWGMIRQYQCDRQRFTLCVQRHFPEMMLEDFLLFHPSPLNELLIKPKSRHVQLLWIKYCKKMLFSYSPTLYVENMKRCNEMEQRIHSVVKMLCTQKIPQQGVSALIYYPYPFYFSNILLNNCRCKISPFNKTFSKITIKISVFQESN